MKRSVYFKKSVSYIVDKHAYSVLRGQMKHPRLLRI